MKNDDEAKKALQRYKAEQDKLFDDLRNELNFQKPTEESVSARRSC